MKAAAALTLTLTLTGVLLAALAAASVEEEGALERCWERTRSAAEVPPCLIELAFALGPRALGDHWERVAESERVRFQRALATDIKRRFGSAEQPVFRSNEGGALEDVFVEGRSIVDLYREESRRVLDRYGLAQLVAELDGSGVVVIDDFEDDAVGELPEDWSWRGWGEVSRKPYEVVEENGNRFLRAEDRGENVMLYKQTRWDSRKYRYLGWRWRIRSVPEGADERIEERADSAAGVYLSYRRKLGLVPETVKFVWSGRLAPGSAFRRPGIGMPWTIVAGSGEPEPDRWRHVVYETAAVYRRTFGGSPGESPLGVGLLSDANSTGGLAAADYDDFVALERAERPETIRQILELLEIDSGGAR